MKRVRSGCPEAAREVFERYSPHIRRVVRRKLHQGLRPQFDSCDFLQVVWASFFTIPPDQYTFESPDALVGFLSTMAYNKVIDEHRRRLGTQKYGGPRECAVTDLSEEIPVTVTDRQPTPSQLMMADERLEKLTAGEPECVRAAVELLRLGHTHEDVAKRIGLNPKALQRLLRRLTRRAEAS